jgi:signal transduction histidine kinase
MMTSFLLANRFPLLLWWGPQYLSIYNDAYRPVLGTKHPWALGQPVSGCWKEIWPILQPLIDTPFHGGPATWNDDICLEINRHGFVEESHFTIAYSPVPDETVPSGIGGVLATVHEITGKVVGDRRVEVLRDLAAQSAKAKTAEEACAIAAETLAAHSKDIPFALLYLTAPDRRTARLAGTAGVATWDTAVSLALEGEDAGNSPWPLAEAMRTEVMEPVPDLSFRLRSEVPSGPWSDPPCTAVVVPIHSNKAHYLAGFLVAGVSPRLRLDASYRDFLTLVSSQLATSIANAREYEEEKKRAEALAEIDRAKIAFFSKVSHEFRTPLTLMLGPIEELLSRGEKDLSPAAKNQLEVTHRNSLRLLRLVNTLLDFSRIEAGRMQAVFEPTDLAAFTKELASVFDAATERAGLILTVDCPSLGEPVYVDREMWEKIVLNLVSNAFKFTFEGEISVALALVDGAAELRVRDTGVGIPAEEIPHLFERFFRVPNTRGRTHEGSGIGLALVQDLVRLHGGAVRVESRVGEGSTFIVSLPLGEVRLRPESVGGVRKLDSTIMGDAPFVQEALRWLPSDDESLQREQWLAMPCPGGEPDSSLPRLLVADDNADLRQYLGRLLSEHYQV